MLGRIALLTVLALLPYVMCLSMPPSAADMYRNQQQIEAITNSLISANPSFHKQSCPENLALHYMVFGNASAIPAVVICNVHARELLTAEVCVDFMTKLVQDDEQGLLGKFHFTLFYTANLMRDTVLSGKYCIRKDENGVDPNRNYPTGFKKSTPPNDETYGGTAPLSQNFTKCLDRTVRDIHPVVYLDLHTGELNFYYQEFGGNPDQTKLIMTLQQESCRQCRINLSTQKDLEGEAYADFKLRYGLKYSILFEIFGGYDAQQRDKEESCMIIFNPITGLSLQYYRSKWLAVLLEFFDKIYEAESSTTGKRPGPN